MKAILIYYTFLSYAIKTEEFEKAIIEERIINGKDALITNHPHQLSLLFNGLHYCGASLISKCAIVTAAHCIMHSNNSKYYSVRAGTAIVNLGGTVVGIKRIVSHPKFNPATMDYDIAVAILSRCLSYGPTINRIKLAQANRNLPIGTHVNASGWGTTYPGNLVLPMQLKSVDLIIIAQAICTKCYGPGVITSRMLCAGYLFGGKDTCQGDSGGPLVAKGALIGVVSWGIDCGAPLRPGVYTRISKVRTFIKKYTGI